MLSTITSYFRRRGKNVLPYWNGTRTVYGDPFKLYRELIHGADFLIDDFLIADVDAGKEPETTKVIEHVCKVFGLTRWDPVTCHGVTDLEVVRILLKVFSWTNEVKKNSNPGPTSPTATTDATSSHSKEPPSETPSVSSDSTSTSTEAKPEPPLASSMPSGTP